jgi:hypothetical protein
LRNKERQNSNSECGTCSGGRSEMKTVEGECGHIVLGEKEKKNPLLKEK